MAPVNGARTPIGRPQTPTRQISLSTPPTTPSRATSSPSSRSTSSRSPRNRANTAYVKEVERKTFLEHLRKWSLNHDASCHFHGSISILPPKIGETYKIGQSARCVLTNDSKDAKKIVTIRLFEPVRKYGHYRLAVRCGSGWMSARDFFNKEYSTRRHQPRYSVGLLNLEMLASYRAVFEEEAKATITVRPLFHSFMKLPAELQQLILGYTIGKQETYTPPQRTYEVPGCPPPKNAWGRFPTKLSSVLTVSKKINSLICPWVYKTTFFQFTTCGLTNFLWLAGPTNRSNIKKLWLGFGNCALLHALRWLAPDEVFELFDPPLAFFSNGLQLLWRCQIQDLVKTLHLSVLVIDLHSVPWRDIPIVVRVLRQCFGSVETVRFNLGWTQLTMDDALLGNLKHQFTWAQLCRDAYARCRNDRHYAGCFGAKRILDGPEGLERDIAANLEFFTRTG
ncbi:hypothetical protein EJ04DRAFT_515888 [Polyplosphaeria fusca]|uniref:F-box domain-containing protein n=1 Tax=Polyplosphaeria fusca TaxID=682080 RepID=A0A9P4UYS9_9PLEO|nr:hypothetical protein EJ04DRAFT_515888 [Polyplosphaeria fusca]